MLVRTLPVRGATQLESTAAATWVKTLGVTTVCAQEDPGKSLSTLPSAGRGGSVRCELEEAQNPEELEQTKNLKRRARTARRPVI